MSAVAEAPKTETPKADPTKIEPVTFNMQEALKSASIKARMGSTGWKPGSEKPPEIKKELETPPPKKEEAKEEPPKEEKKEAVKEADNKITPPVEEKKTDAPTSKVSENLKYLETRAITAEDRVKALESELEKARKEPAPEIQTKLNDYEKQLETLRKRDAELTEKVRAVDVTLDPKFEEEFTQPVVRSQQTVMEMLIQAGATKEDAALAVNKWDYAEMERLTENAPGIQKRLIDAQILETERLAKARAQQIKSPEDYHARRRQQEEEHQKRAVTERERTANDILTGLIESTPALKGDEYKPLRETVTRELQRAAKGEITPRELMGKIAQAEVLTVALAGQHAALEEQAKEIAALKKERDELNEFVKANGGSSLKTEAGGDTSGAPFVPLWKRVVLK